MYRPATGDTGSLDLHAAGLDSAERALSVDGLAQDVHDPTDDTVTDRNREDLSGCLDRLAFLDGVDLTEDDSPDGFFVQVQGQTDGPVLEAQHLVHPDVGESAHPSDAITDLGDDPDLR